MERRARTGDLNPAISAEPRGIGTSRARDPLAREVKLLGALLGQVIVEQEGLAALELVERVRKATIAVRRSTDARPIQQRLAADLESLDLRQAEVLIRAFSLYFQLTNLAEEKQRIRRLRQRQRTAPRGITDESVAAAFVALRRQGATAAELTELVGGLSIAPVLTAHPTEARRRTLLVALRRLYQLLDQLDDPRLTPNEDADLRRRLREEISILWRTAPVRAVTPTPLDEVRSAMALFDESVFVVTPKLYRTVERGLSQARAARTDDRQGQPQVPVFLRWGSWIGGDRDGNPHVTARITRETVRIQSEHVLRAYEAVCRRLAQTLAVSAAPDQALSARLATDAGDLPDLARDLEPRFPDEPYRRRLTYVAERLRRTRIRRDGGYPGPAALEAELREVADGLAGLGLDRVVRGEVQQVIWQLATFGFHAFSLEIRQHSEVHAAALGEATRREVAPGVKVGEVDETLRAIAELQAEFGPEACHRYVVSFARRAEDVLNVLRLARRACGERLPVLDVVPLFESAEALADCDRIVDRLLSDGGYRRHLADRGDRQEIMLGYSDSTKESGALAASWMLYGAQERLVEVCRQHGIVPTLFHGRGGAIGRGGGPMTRAILAQAPGSVDRRLKLTEQGEVVADRYANPNICLRHLEQLTYATLLASTDEHDRRAREAAAAGAPVMDELASQARAAYRALVWEDESFVDFFRAATPVAELSGLTLGSRPALRRQSMPTEWLASLRAIPWVFAWSQSRANLPGWFGTGTALAGYRRANGREGMRRLRDLYRSWPFFASELANAEMILAKADMRIAERYASLAPQAVERAIWPRIKAEFDLTVEQLLDVTGHARLLDDVPVLQRSIDLRNPYVDSLSELQVLLLGRLRAVGEDDPSRDHLLRLVHLTVSGVAAGLQNTG